LLFDGKAKRFYRNYVANTGQTFTEAHTRLLEEFNSTTRQNRVKKVLSRLRVLEVAQKEKISILAALERVCKEITNKAPKEPPTHRDEYHKIDFLHDAVIGLPWAKEPLGRRHSAKVPWTFAELYAALDAANLQEQEEQDSHNVTELAIAEALSVIYPPFLAWLVLTSPTRVSMVVRELQDLARQSHLTIKTELDLADATTVTPRTILSGTALNQSEQCKTSRAR
jgi:hypothetical protein